MSIIGTSRMAFLRFVGSTKPLLRLRLETIASLKHSRSFSSMFFDASRSTLKHNGMSSIDRQINRAKINMSFYWLAFYRDSRVFFKLELQFVATVYHMYTFDVRACLT